MPLKKGNSKATVSQNISEFHTGKTYAHTQAKFGKKKADKQAVAVALSTARKYAKKAGGGKAEKKEKVPLPRPRPGDYTLDNNWRDFRRSEDVEDRTGDPKGTTYPTRSIGELLRDVLHTPDTGALPDALGAQNLEAQQYPDPNFKQRFSGQYLPSQPSDKTSDALYLGLRHQGQDILANQQSSGQFADGGPIEDDEAKQNLEAQGYIPAANQSTSPQERDFGKGLSRWWYGGDAPQPDAQGNLPEADMTNDPISRGLKGVGQALTAPGRAFQGELPPEKMIPEALNMASVVTGGTSLSPVEGGLGTGVGRLAEGPQAAKLTQMEHMERVGMNPQTIYQQTGWYRGDDGMPRYWINDTGAKLKTENLSTWDGKPFVPEPTSLGEVWDHPELYKAYPWLKDVPVKPSRLAPEVSGQYNPMTEAIEVGPAQSLDDLHDTLHHEVVHAIQHHEGFANGGNLNQFLPKDWRDNANMWRDKITQFYGKLKDKGVTFPREVDLDDLHHIVVAKPEQLNHSDVMIRNDLRNSGMLSDAYKIAAQGKQLQKQQGRAFESYLHMSGESEARDAPFLRNNPQALKKGEIPLHKNEELLPYRQVESSKPMPFQRSSAFGGDQVLPDEFVPDGVYEPDPYADSRHERGGKVKKKHPQIDENPQDHEFINFSKGGLIDSHIPGRTDKIPMRVRPGSYVLPADIPSALGEGNSKAGADILKKMFTHSAYGLPPPHIHSHEFRPPHSIVHFSHVKTKADGGKIEAEKVLPDDHQLGMKVPKGGSMCANCRFLDGKNLCGNKGFQKWNGSDRLPHPSNEYCCDLYEHRAEAKADGGKSDHVPIIAAGGEFIVHPDVVKHLGHGDMKKGHKVLDRFVLHTRSQHIKTLKGLKPPK